jgi:hypothetical protein
MKFLLGASALAALLTLLAPLRADDDKTAYLNNGYSLLDKLCDQEKQVDMITIVKTTPKDVDAYLHEVSKAAGHDADLLDDLHDKYPSIRLHRRDLPQFEEDTRKSISSDKQHTLLWGTKGSEFAKTILVTQIEAGTYGYNICKVLEGADPDPHRVAVVRKIGDEWKKLRDRAYALLYAQ